MVIGHCFCQVSHTYILGCLRYGENHAKYILISCGCILLFINMEFICKHGGNGVSTLAKCDGHIYRFYAKVSPLHYV